MKRKLITYLIAAAVLIAFAGCGNMAGDHSEEDSGYEAEEDDDEDDGEADEDDEADDATVTSGAASGSELVVLSRESTSDRFYIVDTDNKNITEVNRADLAANISAEDAKLYRVDREENYNQSAVAGAGGGFIFFRDANYLEDTGEYIYLVYAVSEKDHKLYPIWQDNSDRYLETCDYYDGRVYVDCSLGYDYNADRNLGVEEKCFEYDPDSDSFVEKESGIASVIEEANSSGMRLMGCTGAGWNNPDSYIRSLNECGYILGNTASDYAVIDAEGTIEMMPGTADHYISSYCPGFLIFADSNYDTDITSIYVCDTETKSIERISPEMSGGAILGCDEGKAYYLIYGSEEYGIQHDYVYEYDPAAGGNTLLYEAKSIPGVPLAYPGAEGFKVLGGNIYTVRFENGDLKWYGADLSEGGANLQFKDMKCFVDHEDLFDYGTVEHASYEYACPDCGTVLNQRYGECFVLDGKYSEHADEINELLRDNLQAFVEDNFLESGDNYGSECADHQEMPHWYRVTDDWTVSGVGFIDDRYLTVDMSGYWYGGGAHGYPSRDQFAFDLKTGELLSIKDLYEGTEKDFKTLVAENTKEYFLSLDYYENPFYGEDADAIYSEAYENVFLEDGNIIFTEDGIIYFYQPYLMGPYASGYIDIFISYEELLGRSSL